MSDAQREMTLDEWMDALPDGHRARKEFDALRDKLTALEDDYAKAIKTLAWHVARLAAAERVRDEALVTLKVMLVADMTRNRDLWIKTWAKVPALTAGVAVADIITGAPTGAGGNPRAYVCCEGIDRHAEGCSASSCYCHAWTASNGDEHKFTCPMHREMQP